MPETLSPKQTAFLLLDSILEVFYGGAAGGGKSMALLAAALQYVDIPGYSALLLRKTFSDLALPGALMDLAHQLLDGTDAKWSRDNKTWTFPSGATLTFGYLETDKDKRRYQGSAFQFIGFDELTQFEEASYTYLFSRLRKPTGMSINVPLRMRAASNPGGVGHEWVRQYFLVEKQADKVFIPARMQENPYLDQKTYLDSLNRLHYLDREQLLNGNWEVRPSGGIFRRQWFEIVDQAPADLPIVCRYWDLSATVTGDYTVGLKLGEKNGVYWIMDIQRARVTPMIVEELVKQTAKLDGVPVHIRMEQEPGSSGVNTIDHYARNILQGYIFKGDKKTGDKIVRALPASSAAENGNIKIVRGRYISSFLDELESFPETEHDDQVDAFSGAFQAIQDIKGSTMFQVGQIDFLLGGQDEARKKKSIEKRRAAYSNQPNSMPFMPSDTSDVR